MAIKKIFTVAAEEVPDYKPPDEKKKPKKGEEDKLPIHEFRIHDKKLDDVLKGLDAIDYDKINRYTLEQSLTQIRHMRDMEKIRIEQENVQFNQGVFIGNPDLLDICVDNNINKS